MGKQRRSLRRKLWTCAGAVGRVSARSCFVGHGKTLSHILETLSLSMKGGSPYSSTHCREIRLEPSRSPNSLSFLLPSQSVLPGLRLDT